MPEVLGFFNVDKPLGMTSHDVVSRVRRGLGIKKVGHAGTLDPLATGVLVVCVGLATRLSDYVMTTQKRYVAQVTLGKVTTTYDAEGEIVAEQDASAITREDVEAVFPRFLGEIQQYPPIYSAIKQGGKKLYELARAGEEIERQPRTVTIQDLTLRAWDAPTFTLEVGCSAGTYIRSLAYDIGEALGVGAYLSGLRRTASGMFKVEDAVTLEALTASADWERSLIQPEIALSHMPILVLSAEDLAHVRDGRLPLSLPVPGEEGVIACAHDEQGRFVALLRSEVDYWRPHKVFHRDETA